MQWEGCKLPFVQVCHLRSHSRKRRSDDLLHASSESNLSHLRKISTFKSYKVAEIYDVAIQIKAFLEIDPTKLLEIVRQCSALNPQKHPDDIQIEAI